MIRMMHRHKEAYMILIVVLVLLVCGLLNQNNNAIKQDKLLEKILELESCNLAGIGKTGGFCLDENKIFEGWNQDWGPQLAGSIEDVVQNGSLLDLGAGLGHYGRYFVRKKERIFPAKFSEDEKRVFFDKVKHILETPPRITYYEGYDGALNVERITSGFIKHLDLSKKQDLGRKFDWVLSIEVGEHIPKEYEAIFLDNVVRHACKGVILSWAVEGQIGHFHVNCRNNSYVRERMAERGFRSCPAEENRLRKSGDLWWIPNTVMMFVRDPPLSHRNCKESEPRSC